MPRIKLTAAAVKRLRTPANGQVEYFDELLPSFGLRISRSGTKSWFVMTRVDGKLIRMTLGRHPAVDLAEARSKARAAIELAQGGGDPRLEQEQQRDERRQRRRNTFEVLAKEFKQKHVDRKLSQSTAREYQRILFGADTRHWKKCPISEIHKRDVLEVIERIEARGSPGAAARALAYLRKFFNWCADREVIDASPAERVRSVHVNRVRERVLSEAEIVQVWRAFDEEGEPFGHLFKLLLLTGQRRGEVAGMTLSELRDLEGEEPRWQLSSERTKNKRSHIVPLCRSAVEIIKQVNPKGEFVFSSSGKRPVSGFGKAKERVDARLKMAGAEFEAWTLHDLRRTMVTLMNERIGVAPHVVEAVVNHVSGSAKAGVAGVYNRALYLDERRRALEGWSTFVDELIAGSSGTKVVRFPAKGR